MIALTKRRVKSALSRVLGIRNEWEWRNKNPAVGLWWTLTQGEYRTEGLRFTVPRHLVDYSFRSRFYYDTYEDNDRAVLPHIAPTDAVLELGGCIGIVSCLVNQRLAPGPDRRHVVVEANPFLIPHLVANGERNGFDFVVEYCLIGTGSSDVFYVHDMIVGGSAQRETGRRVRVPVRTVDELVAKHGRFDVLVMDIEGGEYDVICRQNCIAGFRVILIEFHEFIIGADQCAECRSKLTALGFRLVQRVSASEAWVKAE